MPRKTRTAAVIELAAVRRDSRRRLYRERLRRVLDANQQAVARLFHAGLLFGRQGTHAGRDLLLARQHLVRVGDLLQTHEVAGPESSDALYRELDQLLEKSDRLAARTEELLASLI